MATKKHVHEMAFSNYMDKKRGRGSTPSIPEIIWAKNVRAIEVIVVCGFLMKSLKKHNLNTITYKSSQTQKKLYKKKRCYF